MRRLALALTLVCSFSFSATALGAGANRTKLPHGADAAAFEKRIAAAKSWSDVAAQLKGVLPTNVVKEFEAFAKTTPFPVVRHQRNGLTISDVNGKRAVLKFQADGKFLINGQEWKIRPLATVPEEVNRLALLLSGEGQASGFSLIPSANAIGPLAGVNGIAAAAYAAGDAWKADACGGRELSEELNQDCPLMAVGMQPMKVRMNKAVEDPDLFLPVGLKCPAENQGTLELISKNILGQAERLRVEYVKDKPVMVAIYAAEKNSKFEEAIKIDLRKTRNANEVEIGKKVAETTDPLLKDVCFGPKAARARYYASLDANRLELRPEYSESKPSGEKKSLNSL